MTEIIVTEKRCDDCGETKLLTEFRASRRFCGDCERKQHREWLSQIKTTPKVALTHKRCSACKEIKPTSQFWKAKATKTGFHSQCKNCFMSVRKARAQTIVVTEKRCCTCKVTKPSKDFSRCRTTKDGINAMCRTCAREKRYGLTDAEFEALQKRQGKLCAICRRSSLDVSGHRDLSVDHCHATDKVRGLLCSRCNWALGDLDDSPERAYAAYQYLLKHRQLALVV